jgi:MFS transporter, DHA1 family, inner membrane transport protein
MLSGSSDSELRQNFSFEAVGALGTGLFNALVVNFLPVIARREGADPLLLAALSAAPFAANSLGIFSGFWMPSELRRVRYVSLLLVAGRALFLGGLLTTGPFALVAMGFGMYLTLAVASPMQVDIWRGTYPQRLMGRVLGYLRVLQTGASAVAAPLGGLLIERFGDGPMLGLGASLGIVGAVVYSRVRSQPVNPSLRFTPAASLHVLVEQPIYRRLVVAWVVWGFGSFMASPLYALVLVDRFQASYADIGLLQLAGALSGLLAYFALGHYLDRRGGFGVTPLGMLLAGLVPVAYLLAPGLPVLAIGYILLGVGNSAIDLGWQLALVARVSDEHRLRYMAAHTSITGVRGFVAPFVGTLVLSLGYGLGPVLVISGVLGVVGAVMMARALGVNLGDPRLLRGLFRDFVRDAPRPRRHVVPRKRRRSDVHAGPAADPTDA